MQIEWKDSFKLGDAEIDTQHQQLFALANEFLQASGKAELTLCAIQLYKYTREHFEVEEGERFVRGGHGIDSIKTVQFDELLQGLSGWVKPAKKFGERQMEPVAW
jgi:hypothetical protein